MARLGIIVLAYTGSYRLSGKMLYTVVQKQLNEAIQFELFAISAVEHHFFNLYLSNALHHK
jgi:hypothetical protein